jgi:hypothetical protein
MTELTQWDSFYVIIASAAGALIGLQFVVMTLIAEKPPKDAERAGAAFATPTIVHFSASLLVSALMRAPWPAIVFPAVLFGLIGVGGLAYCSIVARRMKKQVAYQPGFEDWLFHVVLPLVCHARISGLRGPCASAGRPVCHRRFDPAATLHRHPQRVGCGGLPRFCQYPRLTLGGPSQRQEREGDVMTANPTTVLVVGATGSVGSHVVDATAKAMPYGL